MKNEGVKLNPLTSLRVGYWLNVLRTKSGMSLDELSKTPQWIDIGEVNFTLYARQRRAPSETTRKLLEKEFPGTLEAYDSGPEGLSLWKILEGHHSTCMAHVESQLAAIPNLPSRQLFFKDKVTQFWWHMVPSHFHFFSLPALRDRSKNVVAQAYKEGFSKDRYRVAQLGKDYSRSQVMAVVALWKLCPHYPESECEPLCRYLLEGLLDEALEDQFEEEIGPMLKGYLHTELAA